MELRLAKPFILTIVIAMLCYAATEEATESKETKESQKSTDNKDSNETEIAHLKPKPGFRLDFKVDGDFRFTVSARSAECYYVEVSKDATVYVSYEVVSGGDRLIDFHFRDLITRQEIFPVKVDTSSDFKEHTFAQKGVAELCFLNYKSSIHAKVVAIAVYRSFQRPETIEDKIHEQSMATAENFTVRFDNIIKAISNMTMTAKNSKSHAMRDYMRMKSNRDYVQFWAILNVVLILTSGLLQVFFVRQFFREPVNRKPRV